MRLRARHLFTLCSAVSLVLYVATVGLWARSYFGIDVVQRVDFRPAADLRTARSHTAYVTSSDGLVDLRLNAGRHSGLALVRMLSQVTANVPKYSWHRLGSTNADWLPTPWTFWQRRGFAYEHRRVGATPTPYELTTVKCPWWLPALLTGAMPAAWFGTRWRGRRTHRLTHGLRLACGYDLRATPGRCPECGAAQAGRTITISDGPTAQ